MVKYVCKIIVFLSLYYLPINLQQKYPNYIVNSQKNKKKFNSVRNTHYIRKT